VKVLQVARSSSLSSLVVESASGPQRAEVAEHWHCLLSVEGKLSLAHLAVEQGIAAAGFHFRECASRCWALARFESRITQVGREQPTLTWKAIQCARPFPTGLTAQRVSFSGPDGSLEQLHKAIVDGHGVI